MSYLYMETVQFKLSLDSLGEIYQLNHWKELNFEMAAIVSSDLSMQLKELLTNDMLISLFPNLHKLATICLSIPISTASVEQSFSDMKLIKNRLRNRLTELSLSNLMKIVIDSPENLTDVIWMKLLTCDRLVGV